MKQLYPIVLLLGLSAQPLFAQTFAVDERPAPDAYLWLLKADRLTLSDNPVMAETLLDLVEPLTLDSVYRRKTERHQFFGAALTRVVGIRWKTVRYTREKVVGTVTRTSISGRERFTEYDVNFDLVPHLMPSREVVYAGYAEREPMFKARKKVKPGQPPYVPPGPGDDPETIARYRIHVECTPYRDLRPALDSAFYPVLSRRPLSSHPSFDSDHPALGVYGPLILDCNHSCGPEIHPYEWIWWRQAPPKPGDEAIWHVGFLRDVSNRFKHWSKSPRIGRLQIPLAFYERSDTVEVRFEHGPRADFDTSGLHRMDLPETSWGLDADVQHFDLLLPGDRTRVLKVISQPPLPPSEAGLRFAFGPWGYDPNQGIITGQLILLAGVAEVYTTAIAVQP